MLLRKGKDFEVKENMHLFISFPRFEISLYLFKPRLGSGREAPAAGTSGRSYREEEKKKRLIVLLQKVPRLSSEPQREAFSRAHGEITRIHFINVDVV